MAGFVTAVGVELRLVHAAVTRPISLLWLAWAALVALQSPVSLRVPFFASAIEALALVLVALLPLLWASPRGACSSDWLLRAAARPAVLVLAPTAALSVYGFSLTLLGWLASIAVHRICGGAAVLEPTLGHLLAQAVLIGLPCASLAGGLAYSGASRFAQAAVWLLICATSFAFGVPVPTGSTLIHQNADPTMTALGLEAVLAGSLATVAGLLLSMAVVRSRLQRGRHANRSPG